MRALTVAECEAIVAEARPHLEPATVGSRGKAVVAYVTRIGERWVVPEDSDSWRALADAGGEFAEVQVVRYPEGGHYVWHVDGGAGAGFGRRSVTTVILLSDPADFAGGELELGGPQAKGAGPVALERGVAVEFPAMKAHRVRRVTRGERWVVVAWR